MSRRPLALALAILSLISVIRPPVSVAQAAFEGVIAARMPGSAAVGNLEFLVKGDFLRLDMSGPGGMAAFVILDRATGASKVVIPVMQMYMDQNIQLVRDSVVVDPKTKFKWTGKKETIAGYECEHATVEEKTGTTDMCLAKGLGKFLMPNSPMGGNRSSQPDWQAALGDSFPLRVQQPDGSIAFEVTKIEKKTLEAELFVVPDSYQKMAFPTGRRP